MPQQIVLWREHTPISCVSRVTGAQVCDSHYVNKMFLMLMLPFLSSTLANVRYNTWNSFHFIY